MIVTLLFFTQTSTQTLVGQTHKLVKFKTHTVEILCPVIQLTEKLDYKPNFLKS